jgi:hypothetical protein
VLFVPATQETRAEPEAQEEPRGHAYFAANGSM